MAELGYVYMGELCKLRGNSGLKVERDVWWQPKPMSKAKAQEWPSYFGEVEEVEVKEEPVWVYKIEAKHCKPAFLNVFNRETRVGPGVAQLLWR